MDPRRLEGEVASCLAEDGSLKINDGPHAIGRVAITAAAEGFMTAFSDMIVVRAELRHGDDVFVTTGRLLLAAFPAKR